MGSAVIFTKVICSIIVLTSSEGALPCTHPLRIILPDLFRHCDAVCSYTTWSSWRTVPNSVVSVPEESCPSEKAYTEERTRLGLGNGCTESLRETQSICLPTQEERLILSLGLGSSGRNMDPLRPPPNNPPPDPNGPQLYILNHPCHNNKRLCETLSDIDKRSIRDIKKKFSTPKKNIVHSDINPIPFDWLEHGPRLRNKRQTTCGDQSVQHVLFVIDTSGSIGPTNFNKVKGSLAKLPLLFCKQVQFAAITFSGYVNLEFCFDCFENTFLGRFEASFALNTTVYRGGYTHTGATARCVCEEILKPYCGIEEKPDCLDVVFITDGKSNDPTLEICEEVKCLHDHLGVDTYAIGIGNNYNIDELNCISHHSDVMSAFEYESFDKFDAGIDDIIDRLYNTSSSSGSLSCARLDTSISTTGVPDFKK